MRRLRRSVGLLAALVGGRSFAWLLSCLIAVWSGVDWSSCYIFKLARLAVSCHWMKSPGPGLVESLAQGLSRALRQAGLATSLHHAASRAEVKCLRHSWALISDGCFSCCCWSRSWHLPCRAVTRGLRYPYSALTGWLA